MTTTSPEPTATASDADVLVDVRGLKVHYPITKGIIFDKVVGHVYAVDGVDLQIRRGETYGLVGESGCGKSTVGKAVLRLIRPTDGEVFLDGTSVRAHHEAAGAKGGRRPMPSAVRAAATAPRPA